MSESLHVPALLKDMQAQQDSLKSVLIIYRTVDELMGWRWDVDANIYEFIGALDCVLDELKLRVRELKDDDDT